MKKWKVDYAYRKDGKYLEGQLFVCAMYLDAAYREAFSVLTVKAWNENWDTKDNGHYHDRFFIWNIGFMVEDKEDVI